MITRRRTPRPKALWKRTADAKADKKARRAAFYAGRAGTRTLPKTRPGGKTPARDGKVGHGARAGAIFSKKMKAAYYAAFAARYGKPRKMIRPRSRRMSKLMAYYRKRKAEYLTLNWQCEVHRDGTPHQATQIHHKRGKIGPLRFDERFWAGVCFSGHRFIDDNKQLARECGLLCDKNLFNHPPEDAETRRLRDLIKELTK
jgi:hypothetical protein